MENNFFIVLVVVYIYLNVSQYDNDVSNSASFFA